jgi:uncharacterized protein
MEEIFFEALKEKVKPYFENVNPCHDFSHIERVYNLALQIAKKEEGINLDVVKLSALLHDIAYKEQEDSRGKICHAIRGAEIARSILEELVCEESLIEDVVSCIRTHRFRKGELPETKEAKILYDSDKLDSIGAIGILRASSFAGSIGSVVHNPYIEAKKENEYTKEDSAYHEYLYKLKKVKDKLFTNEGKRIAESRHLFMEDFFERANKEWEGKL